MAEQLTAEQYLQSIWMALRRIETNLALPPVYINPTAGDTGIDTGLPVGRSSIDLPPLVLAAGQTVGINVPFAGAANTSFDLYWWED